MDILNRIADLRCRKGWSEYELAKRSDLPQSTISSWYKKEMLPSIPSLEKICTGLGITLCPVSYTHLDVYKRQGFDTLAAQTILALKNAYPQVKLILVLPCQNQSERWNRADRAICEGILVQADKVVYISEHYYKGCMHKRNRHLVDCSDYCICYLNRLSGGTYYTVHYAREKGLKIINCAEQLG